MTAPSASDLLLAALPVVTLILLLFLRVRPMPAAAGAIVMLLILGFRFPISGGELLGMSKNLTEAVLNIVFILFGAMVLSVFATDSGAQQTISEWFETVAHNRDRAILLYGIALTPFLESAIGWGVSLIVAVPLLMRSGITPTRAVIVGLLGLVVCPWGSLGPGLIVTAQLGGLSVTEVGTATALYSLPVILIMATLIAIVGVGRRMTLGLAVELLVASLVLWSMLLLINALLAPAVSGLLASLATLAVFLVSARIQGAKTRMSVPEMRAFGPFAVLLIAMLSMIALTALIDTGGWDALITSPGLWMMVSAATAPLFFGMAKYDVSLSLRRSVKNWVPVTITTLLYVVFGMLLSVSGMSTTLAEGAASNSTMFLLLLPFISLLAGYLTTSVTVIGTMLSVGVTDAAIAIGSDPAAALGVQTAAGGAAVQASPSRIILAMGAAKDAAGDQPIALHYGAIALTTAGAGLLIAATLSITLMVAPI